MEAPMTEAPREWPWDRPPKEETVGHLLHWIMDTQKAQGHLLTEILDGQEKIVADITALQAAVAQFSADVTTALADVQADLATLQAQIAALVAGQVTQDQIDTLTATAQSADGNVQEIIAAVTPPAQ
jgi:hypothetical protein